jgi:hypothetical protein
MVLLDDEAQVDARLEIVLIFTQHRCLIGPDITQAQKSFWTHPMELLGDVGHVESRFGPFGDSVCVSAGFAPNVPWAQKSFWTHLMTLLGDEAQVEARFCPFGDRANFTQDRCTVWAKRTTSSEIILDAHDGTPR